MVLFIGILFFLFGFAALRQKRLIENVPTVKIRAIPMGLVEISGEVAPWKETLVSPITKKPCVFYRCTLKSKKREEKRGFVYESEEQSVRAVPFLLRDETGSVLIEPTGAAFELRPGFSFGTDSFTSENELPQEIREFLRQMNLPYRRGMIFLEQAIAPGDRLYILGTADENPFIEEARARTGIEDTMIQRGQRAPYYISDKPEKEILKSHTLGAIICLAIGVALILFWTYEKITR